MIDDGNIFSAPKQITPPLAQVGNRDTENPTQNNFGLTTSQDEQNVSKPLTFEKIKESGNELLKQGKLHEAVSAYTGALDLAKSSNSTPASSLSSIYSNRACAFVKLHRWDDVVTDCSTALELCDSNIKAWYRRATAFFEQGRLESAWNDLLNLESIVSDETCLHDIQRMQKKISLLQDEPYPEIKLAYTLQALESIKKEGNSRCSQGDYGYASKCYSKGIWLSQKLEGVPLRLQSVLHSNKAFAELKLQHWSQAEVDCMTALDIDQTNRKARFRLAQALFKQDKHEAASRELTCFINESPADVCHVDAVKLFWEIQTCLAIK
jgi:tetratricopeptide (TPR) repeat protein